MWGVVNILQLIVYYHFIKVRLAAHADLCLTKLKIIAFGEFIPYDRLANKAKEILQMDFIKNFTEPSIIDEIGNDFILGAVMVLLAAFLFLLGTFNSKLNATLRKLLESVKSKLIWSAFIRLSL